MTKSKVLYIDDEQANLTNFAASFDDDFEVLTASSGAEGLGLLDERGEVAIVISDQRMPGLSGVDVLFEITRRYPDTMRLVLTAYTETSDFIGAINRGHVFRYILKPWDENELRMSLQNCVVAYVLKKDNKRLVAELEATNLELARFNAVLEEKIAARTLELYEKNTLLIKQNEDLLIANSMISEQKVELEFTNEKLAENVRELENAIEHIDLLKSLLPICSYCKKIRTDKNYWLNLERYFHEKLSMKFTHSICPACYVSQVRPQLDSLNIHSTYLPTDENYDE